MIRATKAQLEEFKESLIWKDICDELNALAENAKTEYDVVGEPRIDDEGYKVIPNTSETLIHLGDIKGRRKAVRYFLEMPDILIRQKEIEDDNSTGG